MSEKPYTLGIDIGSTTVKVALLSPEDELLFSDYRRHFANIRETLYGLVSDAIKEAGDHQVAPVITGSGGLTLAKHLGIPFCQEVVAVATALTHYAPQTRWLLLYRQTPQALMSMPRATTLSIL